MLKVVLLGGGNVAYHLTNVLLHNSDVKVVQVYNRSIQKIQYLATDTTITNRISELKEADIYIIAVSDNAIYELSNKLPFKNKFIVHTSGAVDMETLSSENRKGVFYLLQSFSRNRTIDFSTIPICIEAENKKDLALLKKMAISISTSCVEMDSNQRKNLHIAAVFVNNFVNHLYHTAQNICSSNDISFEILRPLILETASKLETLSPLDAQTGPAKRNDTKTIKAHLSALSKTQQKIYSALTTSILKTYEKKL